jgi:hypothetical protein
MPSAFCAIAEAALDDLKMEYETREQIAIK